MRHITAVVFVDDAIEITYVDERDLRENSGLRRTLTFDPDLVSDDVKTQTLTACGVLLDAALAGHDTAARLSGAPDGNPDDEPADGLAAWERAEREATS